MILGDQTLQRRLKGARLVPRHDMLGRLSVAGGDRRVLVKAEDGEVLERALRGFLPETAGEYDDLVTAVACPIWFSEGKMGNLVREPLQPREAIEPYRQPTFNEVLKMSRRRGEQRRTRI